MADLGKITPIKPTWSRVGETIPEGNTPHPQHHPEKKEDENSSDADETESSKNDKKPSDPDDEHQIDIFV
jgi:hypothetical protein